MCFKGHGKIDPKNGRILTNQSFAVEQFLYELAKVQGVHAIGLFDCCRVVMQASDSDSECLGNKSMDKLLESANVMTVYRDDISHE